MTMKMVNAGSLTRLILISTATFLLFQTANGNPIIHPNPPTMQPLCISQFALANHACASIPTFPFPSGRVPVGPPPPPAGLLAPSLVDSPVPHNHNNNNSPQPAHSQPQPHHHHHHHHHPAHTENNHPREPQQQQGGGHHHHHHRQAEETEAQRECCKWLRAVDDMCVCDLLVYLPVFLSRPAHDFTVIVEEECEVRFECLGRRLLRADP